MNTTRLKFSACAITILLIFAASATAEVLFTRIAVQDNITYYGFPGAAINSDGTVVFNASLPGGQSGYFTGKGGTHQEILTTSDGFSSLLSWPAINDNNMIVFSGQKTGEFGMFVPGVFSTAGGTVNDLALKDISSPDGFKTFHTSPHINSDTVAFTTRLNTNRDAIFTVPATGGTPAMLIGNSSEWLGFGGPSINSNGLVACWAYHSPDGAKIMTTSGSTTTTIADTSGSYTGFASDVSVNRHGQVAYVGYVTINETSYMGLYLSDGTNTQTIAETAPAGAYTNIQFPCVSDSGLVSFFGRLPDNREGIFTGPNPATSTVVIEGGEINGRTIYNVMYSIHGMNNVGQIAFVAQFDDDYYYNLYRFDPTGSIQENPVIGTYVDGGPENRFFDFPQVLSDTWVDPPIASGFTYAMTDSSLFTGISDFPTGFTGPFTVSVDSVELGDQFIPGDKLIFADYPTELGALLQNAIGVTHFTVSGIGPVVNPTDPVAFPLRITFDTDFADMTMTPILADCDSDGDLDLADMEILASFWLTLNCDIIDCHGADIDQDNDVDLIDFNNLASNWD